MSTSYLPMKLSSIIHQFNQICMLYAPLGISTMTLLLPANNCFYLHRHVSKTQYRTALFYVQDDNNFIILIKTLKIARQQPIHAKHSIWHRIKVNYNVTIE